MKKFRLELKWAIRFVLASLAWMILEKTVGLHDVHIAKHPIYTNLFAIVAIVIYVLALLDKRKTDFNGKMSWKQGFNSGIVISIIVAVFSPLTQYITSTIITPEYFNNVIAYVVETGKMSQEAAEGYFSLGSYIIQGFFGALTMGIVTSAIVAFFVKKQ
ncbi:hypothetical protein KCTC52924_01464 [Arenibacter antarcticus]|uniref:DUF4199 domain-containing protein n=1 Tax=Arenibacter antarcticus TaxID=2040469 RepID=A0ABW5VAZ1_9FLAO|nr:DUF4199 domain-containing protein [Arenibacter sp. H213]MCM4167734.1 DUF4199 domain-containing protein [Arenibacter sp. H213]